MQNGPILGFPFRRRSLLKITKINKIGLWTSKIMKNRNSDLQKSRKVMISASQSLHRKSTANCLLFSLLCSVLLDKMSSKES